MIKVALVLGVRPNIIKLSPLIKKLQENPNTQPIIIHTGQHYDFEMSDIFFQKLEIPNPNYHLDVGSGSSIYQISESMKRIEKVLIKEQPSYVVVIGDANPTLAGALVARKLNIPLIHIEAGLRSCDMKMPEEVNRVIVDNISDFLITPTNYATENLKKEGIPKEKILQLGDLTSDVLEWGLKFTNESDVLEKYKIKQPYILTTIHRAENTNNLENLKQIMEALDELDNVIFPIHPRTKKILEDNNLVYNNIKFIEPQDYINFLALMQNTNLIISDSGGIQKEAVILKVPCVIPRDTYEWKEGVDLGVNIAVGANKELILKEVNAKINQKETIKNINNPYGSNVADKIMDILK